MGKKLESIHMDVQGHIPLISFLKFIFVHGNVLMCNELKISIYIISSFMLKISQLATSVG